MNEETVRMNAQAISLSAEIQALQLEGIAIEAEVEGMKATNKIREQLDQSLAYNENMFTQAAKELREVAVQIRDIGLRLKEEI